MVVPIYQSSSSSYSLIKSSKRKRGEEEEFSDFSEGEMKSLALVEAESKQQQIKRPKISQVKESTHLMGIFYKDIWGLFLQYLTPREIYGTWRRVNKFFKDFAPKTITYFQLPYYDQVPVSRYTGSPLKFIRLSTPLFDEDLQNLTVINRFPLTFLDLEEHPLQGEIEANFVKALKTGQVRNLHLYKCSFTQVFSKNLKELNLLNLRLAHCEEVDNATLDDLPITLEKLDLSHCTKITSIASLEQLVNLKELCLGNCRGIGDFTPLKQLKHLQKLDLSNCEIQGQLQWIKCLTSLQVLSLEQTKIEDSDLSHLSQLPLLQSLSLLLCDLISNKGLLFLKQLSLIVLNLTSCPGVSDEGLVHLEGQILLKKLSLRRTQVTEKGLKSLSHLVSLEILNLSSLYRSYMTVGDLKNLTHLPLRKLSICKSLDQYLRENQSRLDLSIQPLVKKLVRDRNLLWSDRYLTFPRIDPSNKTRRIPARSYADYWNLFSD